MIWAKIPDWPYEVSDTGLVRNQRTGRILKQSLHKGGYLNVQLWCNGWYLTTGVHQLVAQAFLGKPKSEEYEVRHTNGNRQDNTLDNINWGTHLQNMRDRDNHGMTARNERNGKIKHSDAVVAAVRAYLNKGYSQLQASQKFGINHGTVHGWAKGRTRIVA